MTDDIIRKATTADYIETIDNLRAEVERLRSQLEESQIKYGVDIASTDLHWQDEIAAKDARIKELEAAVVDGRAQYLLFLDCNPDCTAWNFDELLEEDQNTLRRQARISLKMEEPWVYVQLREDREQIKRLEAAFLEVKAGALFCDSRCRFRTSHEHCDYDGGLCEPYSLHLIERCPMKAEWEEQAREALERIRNGE